MSPGLAETLRALNPQEPLRLVALPERTALGRAVEKIDAAMERRESAKPAIDYLALKKRLGEAVRSGNAASLDKRDLRDGMFCLDSPPERFSRDPGFMQPFLKHLAQVDSPRLYRGLARQWIMDFAPNDRLSRDVAELLSANVERMGRRWVELAERFDLFLPNFVVGRLADEIVESRLSLADFLESIRLGGALSQSGLALAVYVRALETIRPLPSQLAADAVDHVIVLSKNKNNALHFEGRPDATGALTRTLLEPFVRGHPTEAVAQRVESFLLKHLRDPRIDPSRWMGAAEEHKAVLLRRLTKASLEQFLQVVDATVNNNLTAKRMWKLRREFWTAYYDEGFIHQAWVAFADNGVKKAHSMFSKDREVIKFGRLSSSDLNHAVLVMKVGGLTIADWSHNGRCRIWLDNNPKKPLLYKASYYSSELKSNDDESFVHHHSGVWTRSVANYISEHSGIRLRKKSF